MARKGKKWAEELSDFDPRIVYKAREEAALKACQKTEPKRKEAFIDGCVAREQRRNVTFYPDGSLMTVGKIPGWEPYEGDARGRRGRISGFTRKSRMGFLTTVATLDRKAELPKFVTLTYPGEYPEEFQERVARSSRAGAISSPRSHRRKPQIWKR